MNGLKRIFAIVFISLMLVSMVSGSITLGFASAETSNSHADNLKIWTDKADYHPGETVTIYGTSFLPNTFIDLNVTKIKDGTNTLLESITDANGNFKATYQIGTVGAPLYSIKATDGTNTATTTFTDATLAVDVSNTASGTGSSVAVTLSGCKANDVIIVLASAHSNLASAITDNLGTHLPWALRKTSDVSSTQRISEYWAPFTAGGSITITLTVTADSTYGSSVVAFAISGTNTASPFDTNAGLPYSATSSGSSAPSVTGVSTTNANDMIIGLQGSRAATTETAGTSYTLIRSVTSARGSGATEDRIVTSVQSSATVSFGTSTTGWAMIVDAVQQAVPTISVSPNIGPVGTTVTVSGSTLLSSHGVTISFDSTQVATTTTDSSGSIPPGVTFNVPTGSSIGTHTVTASDGTSTPIATFSVVTATSIARVQGPYRGVSTSSSLSVSLTSAPTSGNSLIAVIGTYDNSASSAITVSSITQTGVTWSRQTSEVYGSGIFSPYYNVEIWLGVVGSGAVTSVSISLSGSSREVVDICEYSGIAASPIDKTAVSTGSSISGSTGTTTTTAQAQELWIGGIAVGGSTSSGVSQSYATSGFTLLDGASYGSSSPYTSTAFLEKIVSITGTANSGTTIGSSNRWVGCIATFKATYNIYTTTTSLSAIATPLSAGQTGVSFSGSVSSGTAVPNGEPVVLQYSASNSGPWTTAATVNTVGGTGAFSGAFTAPAGGTYYFQAYFAQTVSGSNVWSTSTSTQQTIAVNDILSVSVSPGSWTMDVGQSKQFSAMASGGSGTYLSYNWYIDGALQTEILQTITYSASSTGSYSITVTVTDSLGSTSSLSSPVSVVVNSALAAPSTSASAGTVNQGQTCSLTSTTVSTGTSPFTYQWLEMAPGTESYSAINGATSSTYVFSTTTSTATGIWHFELQVRDSASLPMTVTSSASSVTVNTAPAWDFEDHTYSHPNLTTLTIDQINSEETELNSLFARYGLPTPIAIAYPDGAYSQAVVNVISQYRLIGRTAGGGTFFPEPYPVPEWYTLSSANIGSDT